MPRFEPFPGLRYDPERVVLADVTAPPYDVIDAEERATLAARHPYNVVHLDLPEGGDCYRAAGRCLQEWAAEGVLRRDEATFYGYRMRHADDTGVERETTGVFGALELSRPGEGDILPHEHTTPKAKSDRLELMRGTDANLSAVWGLTPADGLTELIRPEPDTDAWSWTDDRGVTHELWLIGAARGEAITRAVADHPVVIADGHHRYETALAYRDEVAATVASGTAPLSGAGSVLVYLVELSEDELSVGPIHRLIDGLPDGFDLVNALSCSFEIVDAPVPGTMSAQVRSGLLELVLPGRRVGLRPRPGAFDGVADLDSARLDHALRSLPPHELRFQHGADIVAGRVGHGAAQAGVLLRPATVAQILDVAHGGERMPPKTTFFAPKPRTGLVFRTFS